jgi:hypothetical protein
MNLAFIKRNTACVVLMLGITAAWYLVGIRNSVSFWYSDDDYAYLSLAHALSFDLRLHSDPQIGDSALRVHPGLPFYLTSWMAFKIAVPASAQDFIQVFSEGSNAPERFWLISRAIALLLTLGGVALIFRAAAGKLAMITAAVATVWFLAASEQSWIAMSRLGIESFALPYALLFYLAAKNAFCDQRRSVIAWLILGLAGGLGYTLKFHYIAFVLGSAAGLMAMLVIGSCRLSEALKLGTAHATGFVLGFGLLALPILGRGGIMELLRFHSGVATHSGYYGTGDTNVVSPAQVLQAIDILTRTPAFIAALLLIATGATYVMLTRWSDHDWRDSGFPLGVALLVALLLSVLAVLKHFQLHYVVVPVSIIPLLLLYLAENAVPRLASVIFVVLAGVLGVCWLPFTLLHFDFIQRSYFAAEARLKEDVTAIEARSLGPNEIRVWEYRVPVRGFVVGFIANFAGSATISEWHRRADQRDRVAGSVPRRSWRYAILRKGDPTGESARKWREFEPGDRIELLQETIVIERLSADKR